MSYSDTDSDTDSNNDYEDENEENEENEENDENVNNYEGAVVLEIHKPNGLQNEKVIEFIGSINGKAGWIKCLYCDRFHPHSMHLTGMEYCGHCWAWLNSTQLDLEKGLYVGQNSISEIKNYLKETFKIHDPTKCTSNECIYNKIVNLEKQKKLHIDFCVELGFIKKPEPETEQSVESSDISKNILNYNINKKLNTKINYKLSHISI